jgi:hypothetical protein
MTKLFSLREFAAEMTAVGHDLEAAGPKIVERAWSALLPEVVVAVIFQGDAGARRPGFHCRRARTRE